MRLVKTPFINLNGETVIIDQTVVRHDMHPKYNYFGCISYQLITNRPPIGAGHTSWAVTVAEEIDVFTRYH